LADYERILDEFKDQEVNVFAASSDTMVDALELIADKNLTFPVGYKLDPEGVSRLTGAFYEEGKGYLHAAGFVLDPTGVVAVAAYSTGPIGRMAPANALAEIKYLKSL
jgi:peroxiredoxin